MRAGVRPPGASRYWRGILFISDRAPGAAPGIAHVVEAGGDGLVRFPWSNLDWRTGEAAPFDLFAICAA